jgi:hypothetical protein
MARRIAVLVAVLMIAACSAERRAALTYVDEQAKGYEDTKAGVLLRSPCAISIGAYWRALDERRRAAVDALCGK